MSHDYAHCLNYSKECPKSCFRGELVRDLKPGQVVSWMYLRGTEHCPLNQMTKSQAIDILDSFTGDKRTMEAIKMATEALRRAR